MRKVLVFILLVISGFVSGISASAQNKILNARFTATPIVVDGTAEAAWDKATPSHIGIAMNTRLTAMAPECTTRRRCPRAVGRIICVLAFERCGCGCNGSVLPDPFKFQDGRKVKSSSDWAKRRAEIKDLAQYYEYGTMPPPPEAVTATAA